MSHDPVPSAGTVSCGMNSTTLTACHNGNTMPKMNIPAILYSVTSRGTSSWVPSRHQRLINVICCAGFALVMLTLFIPILVLVSSPTMSQRHCHYCAGVVTLVVLASLHWLPPCCTGLVAIVALVSLLSIRCTGIVANIALTSLPSLHWRCCSCRTCVFTSTAWASLLAILVLALSP